MKQELEGSAGLDEALNWVGAVLGPVEAALIRLKFNAMAQGTEENPVPAAVEPGEALMSDDPLVRSEAGAQEALKQDRADAHAAQAGIDNGRNVDRFLTAEMREYRVERQGGGQSRRERDQKRTLTLTVLMASAAYREAYDRARAAGFDASKAADDALALLAGKIRQREIDRENMIARAPKVDGKAVFKDEIDGSVWTEDDVRVSDERAAHIEWKDDDPSRQAFQGNEKALSALRKSERKVQGIQADIGAIQDKLDDKENPYQSVDEVDEARKALVESKEAIEEELSAHIEKHVVGAPKETQGSASIAMLPR